MTDQAPTAAVLDALYTLIKQRQGGDPQSSYTAKLMSEGRPAICQKLGEEATETIIAAMAETPQDLVGESADLLYHLLVLWAESGVAAEAIWAELEKRRQRSGIEEKNARQKTR